MAFEPSARGKKEYVRLENDIVMSHGTFKAGSVMKVVGSSYRGLDLQDVESGEYIYEVGIVGEDKYTWCDEHGI